MIRFDPSASRNRIAQLQRAIQEEQNMLRRYQRIPPEVMLSQQREYINHLEQRLHAQQRAQHSNAHHDVRQFQEESLTQTEPETWRDHRTQKLQDRMGQFVQRRNQINSRRQPTRIETTDRDQNEYDIYQNQPGRELEDYYQNEVSAIRIPENQARDSFNREPQPKEHRNQTTDPQNEPQNEPQPKHQFKKQKHQSKKQYDPRVVEFDNYIKTFQSDPELIPNSSIMNVDGVPQLLLDNQTYDMSEVIDALTVYRGKYNH